MSPVGAFYRIDSMSCKRSHEEIEITANAKVATPIACVFTKNKEKETDSWLFWGKCASVSIRIAENLNENFKNEN